MSRKLIYLVLSLGFAGVAHAGEIHAGADSLAPRMLLLMLQLSVIMIGARFVGAITSRYLRQPRVMGELLAGILIGPYMLGAIELPLLGHPLFPVSAGAWPVSPELYGIATLASILLLFVAGLETDLNNFLRYSLAGSMVGVGGVVLSFLLGNLVTVLWLPGVNSFLDPVALFMGTLSTATSVGITARILSERQRISSPEGVTILAGAVLDDVLGIVLLAVVVGVGRMHALGARPDWAAIGFIALKAFGFWIICTTLGILLAPRIIHGLKWFKSNDIIVGITTGIALLLAGLAEMSGLAMIIGAYVTGLSLSRTDIAHEIKARLEDTYQLLVPVFFCVMGMLVDLSALRGVIGFGLIFTFMAVLGKLVGCGVPAWLAGFNLRGALRIGAGMLPRGEVTLIIAGVGLSSGVIGTEMFGVAVITLLMAAISAPYILTRSLEGGSGLRPRRRKDAVAFDTPLRELTMEFPSVFIADFLRFRIEQAFRNEEFFVHRVSRDAHIYQIRKDDIAISLNQTGSVLRLAAPEKDEMVMRLIVLEEILTLKDMLAAFQKMQNPDSLGNNILAGMFHL